jgi:hypothetical protein
MLGQGKEEMGQKQISAPKKKKLGGVKKHFQNSWGELNIIWESLKV